jgi:hypothetical protein
MAARRNDVTLGAARVRRDTDSTTRVMEEIAMRLKRHVVVVAGLLGLCAIAIGIVMHGGGLLVPNPEHAALLGARAAVHEQVERRETPVPAGWHQDDGVWTAHLRVVETELAGGRVDVAVRVWHDAYGAALESRSWESMIAVGDAFMRIGHAAGTPGGARMNARDAYLIALIRARRHRSVDGALRSAEAFRELGDRAIVEQCLHIAAQLAAGDDHAQQRVREARERWAAPSAIAGS